MVEHLLSPVFQAQSATAIEHLLPTKNIEGLVNYYLLACQSEGKSPRTIEVYSYVLSAFIKNLHSEVVTTQDIRLHILSLQQKGLSPDTVHQLLSNTLGADFCVEALEEALKNGKPEIFNTERPHQVSRLPDTGRGIHLRYYLRVML